MVSEMATHFSSKKMSCLDLGKFYNITHTEKYTLHWQELKYVFEQKDVGVILNVELKFHEHISVKVKKQLRQLSWFVEPFHILMVLCSKSYSLPS